MRTLMSSTGLPRNLWTEAAKTLVYSNNRLLSQRNDDKTRYKLYFNTLPDVSNMRMFGQQAISHVPKQVVADKLSKKGEECFFV